MTDVLAPCEYQVRLSTVLRAQYVVVPAETILMFWVPQLQLPRSFRTVLPE